MMGSMNWTGNGLVALKLRPKGRRSRRLSTMGSMNWRGNGLIALEPCSHQAAWPGGTSLVPGSGLRAPLRFTPAFVIIQA